MQGFEEQLSGGHHNSLGNTELVVEQVLAEEGLFQELFNCYFSNDEVVRLRTSSAVKRVCKAKKELVIPYIDRLLTEIAAIDQASTQWTLAQLFQLLKDDMTAPQIGRASEIMKHNLENHQDWIVLNTSMETLAGWALEDDKLKTWLFPQLDRLSGESRKSVAGRARKMKAKLTKSG